MTDSYLEFPWHDQVPSHPPVSPEIAQMEAMVADLFAKADKAVEDFLHTFDGSVTMADIEAACEKANLAERALEYLRDVEHGNDCTCLPDHDKCNFCRLKRQYKEWQEKQQCSTSA